MVKKCVKNALNLPRLKDVIVTLFRTITARLDIFLGLKNRKLSCCSVSSKIMIWTLQTIHYAQDIKQNHKLMMIDNQYN